MNRTLTKTTIGQDLAGNNTKTRWMLTIEDDPSEEHSQEARNRQYAFLQTLADQPQLTFCGPVRFERLIIRHTGRSWVAEAVGHEDGVLADGFGS